MAGEITTIARPYAEAAFAAARESRRIESWAAALNLLSAVAGNPDLAGQMSNPSVPRERMRDLMLEIAGDALPEDVKNLVDLLAANDRLVILPEIARLFAVLETEERAIRQVHVRSPFAIDAAQQKGLAAALKRRLGSDVDLTLETDASLIGGIEVRADDLVIDGSVRGKLRKLAAELQIELHPG